jgi:hypothetical protein
MRMTRVLLVYASSLLRFYDVLFTFWKLHDTSQHRCTIILLMDKQYPVFQCFIMCLYACMGRERGGGGWMDG